LALGDQTVHFIGQICQDPSQQLVVVAFLPKQLYHGELHPLRLGDFNFRCTEILHEPRYMVGPTVHKTQISLNQVEKVEEPPDPRRFELHNATRLT
jgi:hypothetical protein